MNSGNAQVTVIGAGLAGCEAALVLASCGITVKLYEMRPDRMTPAHRTGLPAELVCSNSFKSRELPSAHALLKKELQALSSPLMEAAFETAVPAGSALAVDRKLFSESVGRGLEGQPLISYVNKECEAAPSGSPLCIIAAGPLASDSLTSWLGTRLGAHSLHFYDAIAPIVDAESVDMGIAYFASRGGSPGDYLNCPFTRDEYEAFYAALIDADRAVAREFENERFFEACLPVEVLGRRGFLSLAYGPLKPIGLIDPRTGRRPFAVCQLRRENSAGQSFNLVGFQTRLTQGEQRRVFRMIPGLGNAEFLRYGSIHRNTYIDSPKVLAANLSFKEDRRIFLAGQICGSEGYTESVATGHLAARAVLARIKGVEFAPPPPETALGSLLRHITGSPVEPFTPSNIHFGLFPPLDIAEFRKRGKDLKKIALANRALKMVEQWRSSL